ncbi:hypothetical protein [Halorubrum sp. HHNYT27]|uniref:hypothetical protein n=1 Tax=Halorubrum sp. HHNYT27 TaxID=3402275 RepID=UPI003EBD70F1
MTYERSDMAEMQTTLGKLEIIFGGATVFSGILLLGYLVLGGISTSVNAFLLGMGVFLLALVVGAGSWYDKRWLRLSAWPATLLLLVLGFIGIAIGPQIITVAAFALLTSLVMTAQHYQT